MTTPTLSFAAPRLAGSAITTAAADLARRELRNQLEHSLPAQAAAVPRDFDPTAAVKSACTRARTDLGPSMSALVESAAASVIALRAGERRSTPFARDVYAAVEAALAPFGAPPSPADFDRAAAETVASRVQTWAKPLAEAGARRFGRDKALQTFLAQSRRQLIDDLTRLLEPVLAQYLGATVAATLRARVQVWQSNVGAAAERLEKLRTGAPRKQLGQELERCDVSRRATSAGHRYSQSPAGEVFRRYAAARLPGLVGVDGGPGPDFWTGFGGWLEHHPTDVPEDAPETIADALRAFLAETLSAIFPAELGLAQLYDQAGVEPPVPDWGGLATPRVRLGGGARATLRVTAGEAPPDLVDAQAWQALPGDVTVLPGTDRRRVRVVSLDHGITLIDLVRGDNLRPEEATPVIAAQAVSPPMREALLRHLPDLLRHLPAAAPAGLAQTGGQGPTTAPATASTAGAGTVAPPPEYVPARPAAAERSQPSGLAAALHSPDGNEPPRLTIDFVPAGVAVGAGARNGSAVATPPPPDARDRG